MTETRIVSDGYGRRVERGDPHGVGDMNRSPVCRWDGNDPTGRPMKWPSLLDWAVYHGPAWEQWQAFRRSLIGQAMPLRAHRVSEWWAETMEASDGTIATLELADAVRCVNVLRSLRGQFSEYPVLRETLDRLNPELEARWVREKA